MVVVKVSLLWGQQKNWVGMSKMENLILGLAIVLFVLVSIYGYKEFTSPPPKPKVEVKFYNYNF